MDREIVAMRADADRYSNDIMQLRTERDILTESVDQLNDLVQHREDDDRFLRRARCHSG